MAFTKFHEIHYNEKNVSNIIFMPEAENNALAQGLHIIFSLNTKIWENNSNQWKWLNSGEFH